MRDIPIALKPGGYFVLEAYTPKQIEYKTGGPPTAEMMYSKDLLEKTFQDSPLEIVRNDELVRDVNVTQGKQALSSFLARRD